MAAIAPAAWKGGERSFSAEGAKPRFAATQARTSERRWAQRHDSSLGELETPESQERAPDPVGQVLGIVALATLVFAATEGREFGWGSGVSLEALTLGSVATFGFVIAQRRHDDPMLPPTLLRSRTFTGAILGAFLYNFAYYGALFALSIALQADGAVPIEVGIKFAPMTATTAIVAFALGRIVARVGAERPAMMTLTAGALGTAILIVGRLEALPFFAGSLFIGIGGATLPAIVSATLENVPTGRTGVGSAVLNTSRRAGGTFGVAILGSLIGASSITEALFVIAGSFMLGAAVLWEARR